MAATLVSGPSATSAFCTDGLVRDYAAPLKRLPAAHYPPIDEHLPFAPARVFLGRVGGPELITGGGEVGYVLSFSPYEQGQRFSSPLDWHAVARIAKVDRNGTTTELIRLFDRTIGQLRAGEEQSSGDLPFTAEISEPGLYRTEITFFASSGERLAHYGEYLRVLRSSLDVELSLNGASFYPGQTVTATLENRGTESLFYGLGYAIEVFDGSVWSRAPLAAPGAIPAIGLGTGPGGKSSCWNFRIPADAAAGLYRFSWSGEAYTAQSSRDRSPLVRNAEFTILPPG